MQKRGQDMRVVYLDWELDEEVLVSQTRLLKAG